jgi:carbonic anhydrase
MRTTWWMGAVIVAMISLSSTYRSFGAGAPSLSPAQGLARLVAGNQRFQSGEVVHPGQTTARRESLASGQAPFAVILSCSDSRVPPEIIFDQGLGDLFVVRVAGNTVTQAGLESIDYAIDHLGANLVVVLGHDSCGAVKGALDECKLDTKKAASLPEIFRNICPAVVQARKASGDELSGDVLSEAIDLNVRDQVKTLKRSPRFGKRISDGSLTIVGARYNLRTGKVQFFSSQD